MPTYDYECSACEHRFEEFQSIKAKPIKRCPKCGGHKVRRLIGSGVGLIFKGSGFYATDYRSESYKKSQKAEAPPAEGSKKEPAAKGEAAKSEKS